MMLMGEPGPFINLEWPEPVDPRLDRGPLDTFPTPGATPAAAGLEVAGTLGIADAFPDDPEVLRPHRSWMGVSTKFKTYPNAAVLEYAKWGAAHTGGFTLVVSDWLNRYNWTAQQGDWRAFEEGKHVTRLKQDAAKRALEFRHLFDKEGIEAGVVLWSRMIRKIVEESCENDIVGGMLVNDVWNRLNDAAEQPGLQTDLQAIHQQYVPHLLKQGTEAGHSEAFVNRALSGYSLEEIFLSALLAKTGWAGVKVGPEWERPYDAITAQYLAGGYSEDREETPFGAVYLEPPTTEKP